MSNAESEFLYENARVLPTCARPLSRVSQYWIPKNFITNLSIEAPASSFSM
jgi:hypothetical protein